MISRAFFFFFWEERGVAALMYLNAQSRRSWHEGFVKDSWLFTRRLLIGAHQLTRTIDC